MQVKVGDRVTLNKAHFFHKLYDIPLGTRATVIKMDNSSVPYKVRILDGATVREGWAIHAYPVNPIFIGGE